MTKKEKLVNAVLNGEVDNVKLLVMEAVGQGENANEIMNDGLITAMDIVGEKMEAEDMFIPEVLLSAQAMAAGVEILKPHLTGDSSKNRGSVVIGSAHGDLHDIGKNLVKMLLEGAGFTVNDLGIDVEPEKFVSAVQENNADLVGISALLTTTMPVMKDVIQLLEDNGLGERVKVMVGGAPVSEPFAQEIGADGYGSDAGAAVRVAKSLISP